MKITALLLSLCLTTAGLAEKPRIVILTDMSNEPDDQMSFVRFLLYANEFDVEGLIATTSCWKHKDPDEPTMRRVIDAYGKAHANLSKHAKGYPTAEALHKVTFSGVDGYGMSVVEKQLDNEAVRHILKVLEKDDPRPVWFCAWGGGNTLGAAVMKLKRDRPGDAARLVTKIRGYEIALQDDAFAYIVKHFPDAKLISSRELWRGISRTTPKFNKWQHSWGGNNEVFDAAWIRQHVQENHGPLGREYPSADYLWEGDTPSFLYVLPNGLSDPEHVEYGGWGGRFEPTRQKNVRSGTGNDTVDGLLDKNLDYFLYSDARDRWSYKSKQYHNEYCTVFRWREDFQNDFAARMDWCVADSFDRANHNPVAVLNGKPGRSIVRFDAKPGTSVTLSSNGSADPDGNAIKQEWFVYPEAGTFKGDVHLSRTEGEETTLTVPAPGADSPANPTIHVILRVYDDGVPSLMAYRRAVITLRR